MVESCVVDCKPYITVCRPCVPIPAGAPCKASSKIDGPSELMSQVHSFHSSSSLGSLASKKPKSSDPVWEEEVRSVEMDREQEAVA